MPGFGTTSLTQMSEDLVDYATWGQHFFANAVSAERVLAGVNVLAGRPIDVGPMGVGPGRIAKVRAQGRIGTATGERVGEDPYVFHVSVPVTLEFSIDLGMDTLRFDADIELPLLITARARADLAIVLDVTPPDPAAVAVRLKARGLRASLTGRATNVEGELRRFVAKYVARELEQPYVEQATTIDVRAAIDKAAARITPQKEQPSPMAGALTGALSTAMATELEQTAQLFIDEEHGQ